MKKCPFCAEEIQDEAVKCRFCGEFLQEKPTEKPKPPPKERLLWTGRASWWVDFIPLTIFACILVPFYTLNSLLFFVSAGLVILGLVCHYRRWYELTTFRVRARIGLLSTSTHEVMIRDIRYVNVLRSFNDWLMGTKTLSFASAGHAGIEVTFRAIRQANYVSICVEKLRRDGSAELQPLSPPLTTTKKGTRWAFIFIGAFVLLPLMGIIASSRPPEGSRNRPSHPVRHTQNRPNRSTPIQRTASTKDIKHPADQAGEETKREDEAKPTADAAANRAEDAEKKAKKEEHQEHARKSIEEFAKAIKNIQTKAANGPEQTASPAAEVKEFVIICEDDPASLYESIDSEKALLKIPAKTKLEVKSKRDVRQGRIIVTWFEVCYKDKTGWVSQYHTTGDLIKEIASGGESSTPMPGQDDVRVGTFTKEAKKTFQEWVLQNMAVTHFEYPQGSDSSIWVRLKPDLYKTKDSAEAAAIGIARAYKLQTGYEGLVIVTVWHYAKDEVFVKGKL